MLEKFCCEIATESGSFSGLDQLYPDVYLLYSDVGGLLSSNGQRPYTLDHEKQNIVKCSSGEKLR